jgi:IS5 family transposase
MVPPGRADRTVLPEEGNGRPPMPLGTMLRIHFMQQWFGYSDPAMEEALHDVPLLRRFAGLDAFEDVMPDESTILRFRHLLEKHDLAVAIFAEVNAVLVGERLVDEARHGR